MARPLVRGLVVAGAMALVATQAQAQEGALRHDVEVGMDVGWTGFGSAAVQPNGGRVSVFGAWYLVRRLALVADITCLGGKEPAGALSPEFTMCTGSLGGSIDLRAGRGLVPYVRVAVGQTQLDRGAMAGVFNVEERSVALLAGAGIRLDFGHRRRVGLRADALWTRTGVFDGWATHTSVALGVLYRLSPDE